MPDLTSQHQLRPTLAPCIEQTLRWMLSINANINAFDCLRSTAFCLHLAFGVWRLLQLSLLLTLGIIYLMLVKDMSVGMKLENNVLNCFADDIIRLNRKQKQTSRKGTSKRKIPAKGRLSQGRRTGSLPAGPTQRGRRDTLCTRLLNVFMMANDRRLRYQHQVSSEDICESTGSEITGM